VVRRPPDHEPGFLACAPARRATGQLAPELSIADNVALPLLLNRMSGQAMMGA
jgi:hypothetical protein